MKRTATITANGGRTLVRCRLEVVSAHDNLTRDEIARIFDVAASPIMEDLTELPFHKVPLSQIRIR